MQKRPDVQNIGTDRIQERTVVTGHVTTHSQTSVHQQRILKRH